MLIFYLIANRLINFEIRYTKTTTKKRKKVGVSK